MSSTGEIAAVLDQHMSYDPHCFTWSCACGVDFHDTDGSHMEHVAEALAGLR